MDHGVRILGIAEAGDAPEMARRMSAVHGPGVLLQELGPIAALLQPAEAPPRALLLERDRAALLQSLGQVQQRLEIACQIGPLLPCDPGSATCPGAVLPGVLQAVADDLAIALATLGWRQQWDVLLRWEAGPVLEARRGSFAGLGRAALAAAVGACLQADRSERQAKLNAGLAPQVLAIAEAIPAAGDTEAGCTVLVRAGEEARIETALGLLPAAATLGAAADLRGPLPPLSFAALRLACSAPAEIAAAWALLELPERLEPEELARRWRGLAFRLHPDRAGGDGSALADAGAAHRLLRQALARLPPHGPVTRREVLARSGWHLVLPATLAVLEPRLVGEAA